MTNFNIKNVGLTNSYQTAEFDPAGWKELGRTTLSAPTPTYETDFSTNTGWVTSDSTYLNVNTTTEKIDWDLKNDNTDDHITYNLGTALSDTLWVFRCTFRFSTASGTAQFFAGMSSTGGAQNTTQDFIGTCILTGDNQFRSVDSDGATIPVVGDNLASYSWASNTDYFLEIKRTSATAYSCTVRTGSHAGSTVATASGTCTSTTVGLQYILFANRVDSNGGSPDLTIDDLKIYNGITDTSGASDNILVSSLADKKYYMALASTEGGGSTTRSQSQVQMGSPPVTTATFEDDSFSSGWDRTGTQIATNSGSGEIDWNAHVNGTNHSLVHDLQDELGSGVYLGTQYVARFKITVDVIQSGGFAGGNNIIFGFSDSADSVGYTTAQDFHGLKLQQDGGGSGSTKFKHIAVNNTNLEASGTNFATSLTTQTYYVELVRDGNDFTTKLFDSNYSVLTEEESTTVTNIQLRYFKISEDNGFSSSANFSGTVDDIKIYNGLTSLGGVDTGSNYAGSFSNNSNSGGADTPLTSDTDISISDTNYTNAFEVGYIANQASEEKLGMFWNVLQSTALASNAPNRTESVGKWSHTTSVLDRINWFNRQTGDFASGSELVILGWDPTDNQSENFWEELASVKLGSAGDTLDSGTFTAKKYLWFQVYTEGANTETQFRLNNDSSGSDGSSGKYASRRNNDGGSDSTFTNQTQSKINSTGGASHTATFMNGFIINILANEKLIITNQVAVEQTGTGTAPRRSEGVTKWENTSAQVTSIQAFNNSSGDFGTESFIKVWGHN